MTLSHVKKGPRSNFWIEGARMLSFPGEGRGLGQQSSPHSCFVLFQFFSVFVNFLSVFLKLSCGCDVFMFIVGVFFRSLLVNIGKNICMFF